MAFKRVQTVEIWSILRRWSDNQSISTIAASVDWDRKTVRAYIEMAREVHGMGVFCYKHCCGNYNLLLDELPSIGIDNANAAVGGAFGQVGAILRRLGL